MNLYIYVNGLHVHSYVCIYFNIARIIYFLYIDCNNSTTTGANHSTCSDQETDVHRKLYWFLSASSRGEAAESLHLGVNEAVAVAYEGPHGVPR